MIPWSTFFLNSIFIAQWAMNDHFIVTFGFLIYKEGTVKCLVPRGLSKTVDVNCLTWCLTVSTQQMLFHLWVVSNSFVTPWTVTWQVPLFVGFPRQEYWSGLPLPSAGNVPNPRMEVVSLVLQMESLLLSHQGSPSCPLPSFKRIHKSLSLQMQLLYVILI